MKSKISKWIEIDVEFFKEEIFPRYWRGDFEDRVIEVITPLDYIATKQVSSIFLGKKINVFDYPDDNKETVKSINELPKDALEKFKESYRVSFCLPIRDTVNITPLAFDEHRELFMYIWFGDDLETERLRENIMKTKTPSFLTWYYKHDDENRYVQLYTGKKAKNHGLKRTMMIRTIPYDTWKDYVDSNKKSKWNPLAFWSRRENWYKDLPKGFEKSIKAL